MGNVTNEEAPKDLKRGAEKSDSVGSAAEDGEGRVGKKRRIAPTPVDSDSGGGGTEAR